MSTDAALRRAADACVRELIDSLNLIVVSELSDGDASRLHDGLASDIGAAAPELHAEAIAAGDAEGAAGAAVDLTRLLLFSACQRARLPHAQSARIRAFFADAASNNFEQLTGVAADAMSERGSTAS